MPEQTILAHVSGIGIAVWKFLRRHMHISTYKFPFEVGGVKVLRRSLQKEVSCHERLCFVDGGFLFCLDQCKSRTGLIFFSQIQNYLYAKESFCHASNMASSGLRKTISSTLGVLVLVYMLQPKAPPTRKRTSSKCLVKMQISLGEP